MAYIKVLTIGSDGRKIEVSMEADSHSPLTYASTVNIDFLSTDNIRTISITGNIIITTSNRAAARTRQIRFVCDGTGHNFTWPSWVWLERAAPAAIVANKTLILSLECFGTADTDIVANYAVQP